jgi:hypothetical protein
VELADFVDGVIAVDASGVAAQEPAGEIEHPAMNRRPATGLPPILDDVGLAQVVDLLDHVQLLVEVLRVQHVIVCSHYGCGGVKAAMGDADHGLIDNWLRTVKDTRDYFWPQLGVLDDAARFRRLDAQLRVLVDGPACRPRIGPLIACSSLLGRQRDQLPEQGRDQLTDGRMDVHGPLHDAVLTQVPP